MNEGGFLTLYVFIFLAAMAGIMDPIVFIGMTLGAILCVISLISKSLEEKKKEDK